MNNQYSYNDIFGTTFKYCELLKSKYGNNDNLFLPLGILLLKWIDNSRDRFNWNTNFHYELLLNESFKINIKKELLSAAHEIEVQNIRLQGLFSDLCFSNINYVDDNILTDLIATYDLYDFKDKDCESKLINKFMDYLLRYLYDNYDQFSFMSSPLITHLLSAIFDIKPNMNIMDLTCGTGTILTSIISNYKDISDSLNLYGQDINYKTYLICKIDLLFHGVKNPNIYLRDTLIESVRFTNDNIPGMDLILSNLPLGLRYNMDQIGYRNELHNNNSNIKVFADWIFIQRGIHALKDNGKAAFIVSSGTLSRLGEKEIRKKILIDDLIEAVITLPANLAKNSNVQLELLIINKNKDNSLKNKVLFIDCSNYFHLIEKTNSLKMEHIKEIYNSHGHRDHNIIKSLIVDFEEIKNNNFILVGHQYMANSYNSDYIKYLNMRTLGDISLIKRGLQITKSNCIKLIISESDLYSSMIDDSVNIHDDYDNLPYYIKISDLYDDTINFNDKAANLSQSHMDSYMLRPGDILVSARGTLIKTAVYKEDMPPCVFSGNIILIRLNQNEYNPYFLKFYLDSKEGQKIISSMQSGASIVSLNPNVLKTLKIPDIDIDKQNKLAQKIIENELIYKERIQKAEEIYKRNIDNINEDIMYLMKY